MKILICFIDMLRGKEGLINNEFRNFFETLGGKYYENAYSTSTDTFRSFSSVITGKYPHEIGILGSCFVPELFLNTSKHIFNLFEEKKYNIYLRVNPYFTNLSLIPEINKYNLYNNINRLLEDYKNDFSENKLLFYYDENYHNLISRQNTKFQEEKARKQIIDNLRYLLTSINKEEFDKILIFSDHGCTLIEDKVEDLFDVADHRSKVCLFLKDKIDKKLVRVNNTVSLLDIYPTILEWLKIEKQDKLRGLSLEKLEMEREIIYIEDGYCDYQGFPFNKKQLQKYYKLREKNNKVDKIYYFKDIKNIKINGEFLYLRILKKILKVEQEIKERKIFKIQNLDDSFLDENGNIKKYNNNIDILKNDLYNNCSYIHKIRWKFFKMKLFLKKKGIRC